jgi:hypothetical protein
MNFFFLQIDNPFQLMVVICLVVIYLWVTGVLYPGRRWVEVADGIYYEESYYWKFWLPSKINDLRSGDTEWYELEDLPKLEKILEDHLSGKDLI